MNAKLERRHFIGAGIATATAFLLGCDSAPEPPDAVPPDEKEADDPQPPSAVDTKPVVEVVLTHDIVCPWCRIGHTRLARAVEERPNLDVQIIYEPFLLDPSLPPEGADLRARLGAKIGHDRLDGAFQRVTEIGRVDGIVFNYDKVRLSPNSVPGHTLIAAAPVERQTALLHALHRAYFEDAMDIGATEVLEAIALANGFERGWAISTLNSPEQIAGVRQRAKAQSQRGIRGVPHFMIGTREVQGAQPLASLLAAIDAAA